MIYQIFKNSFPKFSIFAMAFILLFSSSKDLMAHAGTTINYRIFFKFNGSEITDVGESWSFDEMTSEMLFSKYKLEKDTTLDKKESIELGKMIMEELSGLRYFTYISVDGKDLGEIKASGFKAKIKGNVLSVAFNNPLPLPVDVSKKTLSIEVKDIDATIETKLLPNKPVVLLGMDSKNCNIDIKDSPFTGGFFTPEELFNMDIIPPKQIEINCKNRKE